MRINKISCTYGAKRHTHENLNELSACVAHFKAFAHPRDVNKMAALGLPESAARTVTRAEVPVVLTYLIERAQSSKANNYLPAYLPF